MSVKNAKCIKLYINLNLSCLFSISKFSSKLLDKLNLSLRSNSNSTSLTEYMYSSNLALSVAGILLDS